MCDGGAGVDLIASTTLVVDRITFDEIESHENLERHESGLSGEQLSCRSFDWSGFVGR